MSIVCVCALWKTNAFLPFLSAHLFILKKRVKMFSLFSAHSTFVFGLIFCILFRSQIGRFFNRKFWNFCGHVGVDFFLFFEKLSLILYRSSQFVIISFVFLLRTISCLFEKSYTYMYIIYVLKVHCTIYISFSVKINWHTFECINLLSWESFFASF